MKYTSESVATLIEEFARMPGIGRKTAQRLAFYILKVPKESAFALADAIRTVKEKVRYCSVCCNITEIDPCDICRNTRRNRKLLCVVEEPSDVIAIERTAGYHGLYHVLQGSLSPLEGIGPEELRIKELLARLDGVIEEVVLATNPNVEGDTTALYLARLIKPWNVKVCQIARGLPVGGDLEFTDEVTLLKALEGRVEL